MSDADPYPIATDTHVREPRRRRWLSTIVVLIVIALAGALAYWLANRPSGAVGGPGGPGGPGGGRRGQTTVGTAKAVVADVPITLDALGTVVSPVTATVRTQIAGTLFSIDFREGQLVRKGQQIAQVDPRPYKLALDQARGTLARDEALLAAARVDLGRYQTLLKQDSIARQQVDTQAALVRQYEGTVATDRGAVGVARLNLSYTSIKAPVSGRAGLRGVDLGNYITPGDTNGIVVITQVTPIDVQFTLPQDRLPQVSARLRSGATLPVTAFDRDGGTALAQGSFSTLDNLIDTTTGTVRAKARFANTDGALFPNQFVNARVLVDTVRGAVTVPATAVRNGPKGNFVFTVEGRTAHLTPVTLGPVDGETISITKGLAAGALVVTEGSDRLTDGGKVTLPGDKPRFGPGAGAGGGRWQRGQGGQRGEDGGERRRRRSQSTDG